MIDKKFYISPRFWAALLAIVLIVLNSVWPEFKEHVDMKAMVSAILAIVAFVAAATVSDNPTYINLFGQLKFWSLVISLAFVFLKAFVPAFPLTEDLIQALVGTLGGISFTYAYRPANMPLKQLPPE